MSSSNHNSSKEKDDKKSSSKAEKSENKPIGKIEINDWLEVLKDFTPTLWGQLPELDLYMDQVVTLLNRQLSAFSKEGENLLTPSMINNYVKDGVLPRPEKKKYTKNHLAMLMMICSLKSVLSLPEIHNLLKGLSIESEVDKRYPEFINVLTKTHEEVISRISEEINFENKDEVYNLALTLALEANIRHIVASKILLSIENLDEKTEN